MDKHTEEFISALNGGRGSLDDWLDVNNEKEVRDAIAKVEAVK